MQRRDFLKTVGVLAIAGCMPKLNKQQIIDEKYSGNDEQGGCLVWFTPKNKKNVEIFMGEYADIQKAILDIRELKTQMFIDSVRIVCKKDIELDKPLEIGVTLQMSMGGFEHIVESYNKKGHVIWRSHHNTVQDAIAEASNYNKCVDSWRNTRIVCHQDLTGDIDLTNMPDNCTLDVNGYALRNGFVKLPKRTCFISHDYISCCNNLNIIDTLEPSLSFYNLNI